MTDTPIFDALARARGYDRLISDMPYTIRPAYTGESANTGGARAAGILLDEVSSFKVYPPVKKDVEPLGIVTDGTMDTQSFENLDATKIVRQGLEEFYQKHPHAVIDDVEFVKSGDDLNMVVTAKEPAAVPQLWDIPDEE